MAEQSGARLQPAIGECDSRPGLQIHARGRRFGKKLARALATHLSLSHAPGTVPGPRSRFTVVFVYQLGFLLVRQEERARHPHATPTEAIRSDTLGLMALSVYGIGRFVLPWTRASKTTYGPLDATPMP